MQEEMRQRTREAPSAPAGGRHGVRYTGIEARKGKPGNRANLEPKGHDEARSREAEKYCQRESPLDAYGESYQASYLEVGKAHYMGKGLTGVRSLPSSSTHLFLHATACGLRRTFTSLPRRMILCCLR